MVELTDLIWTAVDDLGSSSTFCVEAASKMLLTVIQEHGTTLETVRAGTQRVTQDAWNLGLRAGQRHGHCFEQQTLC